MVADAAIGALAGILGWLATRRWRRSNPAGARIVSAACVVLGVVIAGQFVGPAVKNWKTRRELLSAGLEMYGNQSSADLNVEILGAVLRNPKFVPRLAAVQSGSSPHKIGVAELTAAGMARLDSADLDAIFGVKRSLAEASPALCAGFWTGQISAGVLNDGLRRLKEDQQRIWITVSGRALSREIEAPGQPTRVRGADSDKAMADLGASMTPEARAAFAQAGQAQAPAPEIACRGFRALAEGMKKLPAAEREVLMRALNNPSLIDP